LVVNVVEAAGDIRIQDPLSGPFDTCPDRIDGIPATSAWSKAVTVWLEDGLPFGLKDHFHQGLFGSVHHRGYTQGPQLGFAGFRNPDATHWECFV
jgi:hypothetical protein